MAFAKILHTHNGCEPRLACLQSVWHFVFDFSQLERAEGIGMMRQARATLFFAEFVAFVMEL